MAASSSRTHMMESGSGGAGNQHTTYPNSIPVQVSVSCSGLRDRDVFSRCNSVCIVHVRSRTCQFWREVGRTETLKHSRDPSWASSFDLDYVFEYRQELRCDIYDWNDDTTDNVHKQDCIGTAECLLSELVCAPGSQLTKPLIRRSKAESTVPSTASTAAAINSDASPSSTITLSIEQRQFGTTEFVEFQLAASNLDKKDLFTQSDPFFTVLRRNCSSQQGAAAGGHMNAEDVKANTTVVYRSEWIRNEASPTWAPVRMSSNKLCAGDWDRQLIVQIFDHDNNGKHDYIGSFSTTLAQMAEGESFQIVQWNVINEDRVAKAAAKNTAGPPPNSGSVILKAISIQQESTFLDYILAGLRLNLVVAIDFTTSNGDPRDPSSLHYYDWRRKENPYTMAVRTVADIFTEYHAEQGFIGLGFGAAVNGQISHCFPMSGDARRPVCGQGVDGLIDAYYNTLSSVEPVRPTCYAPVIEYVKRMAERNDELNCESRHQQQYTVLLIVTDGGITDMEATKRVLVDGCLLPFSIILVGVGRGDMTKMNVLDDDSRTMADLAGRRTERDIVQFVQLCNYLPNANLDPATFYDVLDGQGQRYRLANEVLAEIPRQVVEYCRMRHLKPLAMPSASQHGGNRGGRGGKEQFPF